METRIVEPAWYAFIPFDFECLGIPLQRRVTVAQRQHLTPDPRALIPRFLLVPKCQHIHHIVRRLVAVQGYISSFPEGDNQLTQLRQFIVGTTDVRADSNIWKC